MAQLSPAEHYLRDFHRRQPGATTRAFGSRPAHSVSSPDKRFTCSYSALAACVPEAIPSRTARVSEATSTFSNPLCIVDLACGDGHLLSLLAAPQASAERRSPKLIGIDMSEGELALARAQLPDCVTLLQERAQTLSLLDGSADVVLSHMALMLIDDIDDVIREIRRVLVPGGRFATIVGRVFLTGEVGAKLKPLIATFLNDQPDNQPFGDPRTRTEDGWRALLDGAFENVTVEDFAIPCQASPLELYDMMMETYTLDRFPEAEKLRFRDALIETMSPLIDAEGKLHSAWGVRLVHADAV